MQRRLQLYIPHHSKPGILALFRAWHNEKSAAASATKKSLSLFKNIGTAVGLRSSIETEWNRCIEATDAESLAAEEPFSLLEYWETVVDLVAKFGYELQKQRLGIVGIDDEAKLMKAIYTALIHSLFIQFNRETDINYCLSRLWFAVIGAHDLIGWEKIPTTNFTARFKDKWWAYYSLSKYNCFSNGIYDGLGLVPSDFIKAFLKPQVLVGNHTLLEYPKDIWLEIARRLEDKALLNFRQVARMPFKMVESELRLRHRLSLIYQSAMIQVLIGRPIYADQHHLISVDCASDNKSSYRITQLNNPFTTRSYISNHAPNDVIMGAKLYQEEGGKFVFLMAYTNSSIDFIIQQRMFSSFADEVSRREYRLIAVDHSLNRRDNRPAQHEEARIGWKKHSLFAIRGNHVTVDSTFEETDLNRKTTGKVEHYTVEFDLTDKTSSVIRATKR